MSFLISCSNDFENDTKSVDTINVTIKSQIGQESTRSNVVFNSISDYSISLCKTDTLGFFSFNKAGTEQQAYQMAFPITEDDVTSFTFTGGGWSMSSEYSYQAYTPFNYGNKKASELPVVMSGQKQNVNGSNGYKFSNLTSYYLMVSPKAAPVNGALSISMSPVISAIRMVATAPATATYTKMIMLSDNKDFITETTFNLETGAFNEPTKTSYTHSLTLDNIFVNQGEDLYLYTCIVPTRITSSEWKVVLVTSTGDQYVCTMTAYKGYNMGGIKDIPLTSFAKQSIEIPAGEDAIDGISGSADDFIPVGGTGNSFD